MNPDQKHENELDRSDSVASICDDAAVSFDDTVANHDDAYARHPDSFAGRTRPLAPGLYLVATPIGNLEDITLRALRVLRSVDRIACEDTRQTQKLLNHFEIRTPTVSYHMHNEAGRALELATALKAGARIAVVSDAGTPGIADPGGQIAAAAIAAGVPVFPVPGANAAISALIASGLAGSSLAGSGLNAESFTFHGFLPSKEGQRRTTLEALRSNGNPSGGTLIFYEAPHRILDTLADVEAIFGPAQHVVVARELTKLHEEFLRGTVTEVRKSLASRASVRGEIVLLFAPAVAASSSASHPASIAKQVRELMASESLAEKDALKRVARARGMGKSEAYRELQRERGK
ncbi:MAG: 16S rRNA (cytidine(1402)-2'-O)-methyltransferase [Acidobacteriaceae bacterium]|nr:16S rRNA (cytidine(1402)-2'-O)-methyltransferase [Acidobacteriaceae bacterium]